VNVVADIRHDFSMLGWDPEGKQGPSKPLPDMVTIVEPKEEQKIEGTISESRTAEINLPGAAQPVVAPPPDGPLEQQVSAF
jgi:small subunit ribosomal protein S3e